MKKRAISLFLLIVMLISLVPAWAFAEDITDEAAVLSDTGAIAAEETIATAEEAAQPEEEAIPDEEVEIIPMPEEEYEEIAEESQDAENDAAEGENTSENSEKAVEDEDKLFPGMPEGYELTVEQAAAKQTLNEYGVLDMLYEDTADVDYVDGEVFFLADTAEYAQTVAEAYGATLMKYLNGVATIALNGASVLDAVTAAADMSNNMPVVEPNYIYKTSPIIEADAGDVSTYALDVNGNYVKSSWKSWFNSMGENADSLMSSPSASDYQYMHDVVNTYEAWDVTKGEGVTVAILDSGVGYHEDLEDVGSGDSYGQGTHVAGIIAAKMGNGIGGAGIAPEAKIYSQQVLEDDGSATIDSIISGLNEAAEADPTIKVINIGFGIPEYSTSFESAVEEVIKNKITVVAAMGDNGTNVQLYPAAFNIPGLIAVQSSNKANTLSYFSNYGAWADVIAPGSNIMSTTSDGGYGTMSSTAMASAVVSGVCALYLSKNPEAYPVEVEAAIKKAANKGIVDASKLFNVAKIKPKITNIESEEDKRKDGTLRYGSNIIIKVPDSVDYIKYTIGSTTPSMTVGTPINEFEYDDGDGSKTAMLPLALNKDLLGKNIIVKVRAFNELGMSAVKSLTVKVGYDDPTEIEITGKPETTNVENDTADAMIISGKTFNMTAKVLPEEANQKVYWDITDRDDTCKGTSINKTTGVLKTGSNDEGTVTVKVWSAVDDTLSKEISIYISPLHPTKKIEFPDYNDRVKTLTFYKNSESISSPVDIKAISYKYDPKDKKKTLYPVYDEVYTWKSSNEKVAVVDQNGRVTPVDKGSSTITCTAKDGTNVKASFSVKVLTCADEGCISISGLSTVAPGKTAQYTAVFSQKTVNYKTVNWEIEQIYNSSTTEDYSSGIEIDQQRGKLTIAKGTPDDTYILIRATTEFGIQATKCIRVSAKNSQVKITSYDNFGGLCKFNSKDKSIITEAKLFSTDKLDSDSAKHYSYIKLELLDSTVFEPVWKSSNSNVATIYQKGNECYVYAQKAGTAKITCTASDAGRKSSSVNIVVINPVSSVNAASQMAQSTAEGSMPILASGKSVRNTVTFGDAYGTPTIKKVEWSYKVEAEVYGKTQDETENLGTESFTDYTALSRIISINKTSGQLTASKNAYTSLCNYILPKYWNNYGDTYSEYDLNITVTAVAKSTDGSDLSCEVPYKLNRGPISQLQVKYKEFVYSTSLRLPEPLSRNNNEDNILDENFVTLKVYADYANFADWTVKSSNPKVAGAVLTYVDQNNTVTGENDSVPAVKIIPGQKAGSATITLTATDGSNKKATVTVKVS